MRLTAEQLHDEYETRWHESQSEMRAFVEKEMHRGRRSAELKRIAKLWLKVALFVGGVWFCAWLAIKAPDVVIVFGSCIVIAMLVASSLLKVQP